VKIAISVPDQVFRRAERAARRMRLPRSQFYALAVEAYVRQQDREDVTVCLNAVHSEDATKPDPFLAEAAGRTFRRAK
jgi:hypothetical protein